VDNINFDNTDEDLFYDVQLNRYYERLGKEMFASDEMFEGVLSAVFQKWIDVTELNQVKFKEMTIARKRVFFESLDLYEVRPVQTTMLFDNTPELTKEETTFCEKLNCSFFFLPEHWREMMWLTVPTLGAFGIENERFREILCGSPVTDEEQEIFTWIYNILEMLICAHKVEGSTLCPRLKHEALVMAKEVTNEKIGDAIISCIWSLITKYGEREKNL